MKGLSILAFLGVLLFGSAVNAEAQAGGRGAASVSPYPIIQGKTYRFEKIADGVYYATGGQGSNDPIIVNDEDVLLVDTGTTPASTRALLQDLKAVTNKPVRYVVNTHWHYDHTDGNSVFAPNVDIIAHEFVRTAILTFDVLNREPFVTSQKTRVPRLIDSSNQASCGRERPGQEGGNRETTADCKSDFRRAPRSQADPP